MQLRVDHKLPKISRAQLKALSEPAAPQPPDLLQWMPLILLFSSHLPFLSLLRSPLDHVWRRLDSTRTGWRTAGVQHISARNAQEAFGGGLAEPDMAEKEKKIKTKTEELCSRIMFCLSCFSSKECKYLAQKNILPFLINCQKYSLQDSESKVSICFYGNLSLTWGTSY